MIDSARLTVLPTPWRLAWCLFFEPAGLPGPDRDGFGAAAGPAAAARTLRNPRRTRAGVSRRGPVGRSQGRMEVLGEGSGQAELGVGSDDEPGPQVGGVRVTDLRGGPAERLFHESMVYWSTILLMTRRLARPRPARA